MTQDVFITRTAAFLPNAPVSNEGIESLLGQVGGRASRARALVLRNNGIQSRHYAIDPQTGRYSHNNARMTAEAVRGLASESFELSEIEVLACGTSSPDQLMPNHGVMVHGELGNPACEVAATSGVCVSGVTSFKYGFMSVAAGLSRNAVVTGSEFASSFMRAGNFDMADIEPGLRRAAHEFGPLPLRHIGQAGKNSAGHRHQCRAGDDDITAERARTQR